MIFGVLYVDTSRKFRKNPIFWAKSISTIFENFERISTEVGSPPPPQKSVSSLCSTGKVLI